jgi:hypothetical protein
MLKNLFTQKQCKCKKFECVHVNDLHLHKIYMPYTHLLTLAQHWYK